MNILIAADYATPASGNFIGSCVELGRVLKKEGATLTFIFPENHNTLSDNSWVHWLKKEGHSLYLVKKDSTEEEKYDFLRKVITDHQIDILHIHFGMFHHLALTNAHKLGVKILVHDHMDFPAGCNMAKQRLRNLIESLLYSMKKIGIVSVNPQKNRSYALARHWYVPNGLSMLRNVPVSASREQVRSELNISFEEQVCLFLGWDLHRKGLDIAVKAVAEVRERNPHMVLAVVGVGTPPNQSCVDFLANTTGIDAMSPWIRYLPSREDMFAYHRAVDVYLSSSRSEAFSYGILEAISQNTPVVVSDIDGTSWCHDYDKAVVYSTEDSSACAEAICKALELGRRDSNADRIVNDYSIEKWCSQMMDVYKKL